MLTALASLQNEASDAHGVSKKTSADNHGSIYGTESHSDSNFEKASGRGKFDAETDVIDRADESIMGTQTVIMKESKAIESTSDNKERSILDELPWLASPSKKFLTPTAATIPNLEEDIVTSTKDEQLTPGTSPLLRKATRSKRELDPPKRIPKTAITASPMKRQTSGFVTPPLRRSHTDLIVAPMQRLHNTGGAELWGQDLQKMKTSMLRTDYDMQKQLKVSLVELTSERQLHGFSRDAKTKLEKELKGMQAEMKVLEAEHEDQVASLSKKLEAKELEIDLMKSEMADLFLSHEREVAALSAHSEERAQYESMLAIQKMEKARMADATRKREGEFEALAEKLEKREVEANELRSTVENMVAIHALKEAEKSILIADLSSQLASVTETKNMTAIEKESLQGSIAIANAEIVKLTEKELAITEASSATIKLKAELTEQQRFSREMITYSQELEEDLELLEAKHAKDLLQLYDSRRELATEQDALSMQSKEVAQLRAHMLHLRESSSKQANLLRDVQALTEEKDQLDHSLRAAVSQIPKERRRRRAQRAKLSEEIRLIQDKLFRRTAALQKAKGSIKHTSSRLEALSHDKETYQYNLMLRWSEIDMLKRELANAKQSFAGILIAPPEELSDLPESVRMLKHEFEKLLSALGRPKVKAEDSIEGLLKDALTSLRETVHHQQVAIAFPNSTSSDAEVSTADAARDHSTDTAMLGTIAPEGCGRTKGKGESASLSMCTHKLRSAIKAIAVCTYLRYLAARRRAERTLAKQSLLDLSELWTKEKDASSTAHPSASSVQADNLEADLQFPNVAVKILLPNSDSLYELYLAAVEDLRRRGYRWGNSSPCKLTDYSEGTGGLITYVMALERTLTANGSLLSTQDP